MNEENDWGPPEDELVSNADIRIEIVGECHKVISKAGQVRVFQSQNEAVQFLIDFSTGKDCFHADRNTDNQPICGERDDAPDNPRQRD